MKIAATMNCSGELRPPITFLRTLLSEPILDMDSNSGHKGIEAMIIWMVHTFHHALHNVGRPKSIYKYSERNSRVSCCSAHDAYPSSFIHQSSIMSLAVEWIRHSNHSVWKECAHSLISVSALVAFEKNALIYFVLWFLVTQASRSRRACQCTVYQPNLVRIWGPVLPEYCSEFTEIRHP